MTTRARLLRGLGAQSYGRLVMMGGQILAVPLSRQLKRVSRRLEKTATIWSPYVPHPLKA